MQILPWQLELQPSQNQRVLTRKNTFFGSKKIIPASKEKEEEEFL